MDGSLKSWKVLELNKYLDANRLTKAGEKEDKIKAIACHIIRANTNSDENPKIKIQGNLETIEDGGEEDSDTIQSDSSDDEFQKLTVIRSGRVIGSWKNSFIKN